MSTDKLFSRPKFNLLSADLCLEEGKQAFRLETICRLLLCQTFDQVASLKLYARAKVESEAKSLQLELSSRCQLPQPILRKCHESKDSRKLRKKWNMKGGSKDTRNSLDRLRFSKLGIR